jgi:hypothetical protein
MNVGDATHSAVQLLLCVFKCKKITSHTVCAAMGKGFGLLIVHKQNFIHTTSHGVIFNVFMLLKEKTQSGVTEKGI